MPDEIDELKRLFSKKKDDDESSSDDAQKSPGHPRSTGDDLLAEIWSSRSKAAEEDSTDDPASGEPGEKTGEETTGPGEEPDSPVPPKSERPDTRSAFSMMALEHLKQKTRKPGREEIAEVPEGEDIRKADGAPEWADGVVDAKAKREPTLRDKVSARSHDRPNLDTPGDESEVTDLRAKFLGEDNIEPAAYEPDDEEPVEPAEPEDYQHPMPEERDVADLRAKFLREEDIKPPVIERNTEEPVDSGQPEDKHSPGEEGQPSEDFMSAEEPGEEPLGDEKPEEREYHPPEPPEEIIEKTPEPVREEIEPPVVDKPRHGEYTFTPKKYGAEYREETEETREDARAKIEEDTTEAAEEADNLRVTLLKGPSEDEAKSKRKKPVYHDPVVVQNPLVNLIGLVGAICLGVALVLSMMGAKAGLSLIGLSGVGTVMIVVYSVANRRNLRLILSARSTRYGSNVGIVILTLFSILVVLNSIGYSHYAVFDVTSEKLHTLSEQTMQVFDKLHSTGVDVKATVFVPREKEYIVERNILEDTLEKYRRGLPKLDIEYLDPDVNRQRAQELGFEDRVGVVFQAGDKKERAVGFSQKSPMSYEAAMTGALLRLTGGGARRVYFLTGHNELVFDNFSDNNAHAAGLFAQALEQGGYQVKALSFSTGAQVPADCSLLAVAGPTKELTSAEVGEIKSYLDSGGRVILLLEARFDAGLSSLLEEYGIRYRADLIADMNNNLQGSNSLYPVLELNEHEVTAPLRRNRDDVVFFRGSGMEVNQDRPHGYYVERLLSTKPGGGSWSESGESEDIQMDPEEDRGPFTMAVIAGKEIAPSATPEGEEVPDEGDEEIARKGSNWGLMLVAGDSSFITNPNLNTYGNKDFILNAVEYMTSDEALITIRPKEMRPMLELKKSQAGLVFLISIVLIPLLVAGFGVTVWVRRK